VRVATLSLTFMASGPPVRLILAFSPPNARADRDIAAAIDAETPINSRLFIVRTLPPRNQLTTLASNLPQSDTRVSPDQARQAGRIDGKAALRPLPAPLKDGRVIASGSLGPEETSLRSGAPSRHKRAMGRLNNRPT